MKKMDLAGNLCMCMSMQRWSASLMKINEFSLAGYPAGTLFVCQRAISAGLQTKGTAPRQLLFTKATATILTEATFESGMGAPKSQRSGEVFLCTSYSLQNTNGQEVELIWLAWRGPSCRGISSSPYQKPSPRQEPGVSCR